MDFFGKRQIALLEKQVVDLRSHNSDLINEIRSRFELSKKLDRDMEGLRSQLSKTEAEAQNEQDLIARQISDLQVSLKSEFSYKEKLETNIKDLKTSKDKKVKELNDLKSEFEQKKKTWASLEQQVSSKTEELTKIYKEKESIASQLEKKDIDIQKINLEKNNLQGKIKDLSSEASAEKNKNSSLSEEAKKANENAGKAEKEKKNLASEKSKLENEIEKLKKEVAQVAGKEKSKIDELSSKLEGTHKDLEKNRKELNEEKKKNEKRLKEISDAVSAEQAKHAELAKQLEEANKEKKVLQDKLAESESRLKSKADEVSAEREREQKSAEAFKKQEGLLKDLAKENAELKEKLLKNEQEIKTLNGLASQKDLRIKELEKELKAAKDAEKELEKTCEKLASEKKEAENRLKDLESLRRENEKLKNDLKNLESEKQKSKSQALEGSLKEIENLKAEKQALEAQIKEIDALRAERHKLEAELQDSEKNKAGDLESRIKELSTWVSERDSIIQGQNSRIQELTSLISSLNRDQKLSYDLVLKIERFFDISHHNKGWELLAFNENILKHKQAKVCSILGQYNKGKSFVLNKLTESLAASETKTDTTDVSLKAFRVKDSDLIFIDTPGYKGPLNGSAHDLADKRLAEIFTQNLAFHMSQVFLVVVNEYSHKDQKFVKKLEKRLKSEKRAKTHSVIVVHNLRQVDSKQVHDLLWTNQTRSLFKNHHSASALQVDSEVNAQGGVKRLALQVIQTKRSIHCSIVDDRSEYGAEYNLFVYEFLKNKLVAHPVLTEFQVVEQISNEVRAVTDKNASLRDAGDRKRISVDEDLDVEEFRKRALLFSRINVFCPAYDCFESNGEFYIVLDIPGLSLDDVKKEYKKKYTRLTGARRPEYDSDLSTQDRKFGEFVVEVPIPAAFSRSAKRCTVDNGVMTLVYEANGSSDDD